MKIAIRRHGLRVAAAAAVWSFTFGLAGAQGAAKPPCSVGEVQLVVEAYQKALLLIASGDLQGLAALDQEVTGKLSGRCLKALKAAAPCSDEEQALLAEVTERALAALVVGDLETFVAALQRLQALSPKCQAALAQQQAATAGAARVPAYGSWGGVQDHGGGTYVAPGLGYCDSSGCGAF